MGGPLKLMSGWSLSAVVNRCSLKSIKAGQSLKKLRGWRSAWSLGATLAYDYSLSSGQALAFVESGAMLYPGTMNSC